MLADNLPVSKQRRAVCVSLHDVAPATWPACLRLLNALDQVAQQHAVHVPVTLLVVPDYHHQGRLDLDPGFRRAMEKRLARGDEIALHGYYHLDDGPPARSLGERLQRRLYTHEGEFAALNQAHALERLEKGLELLHLMNWPVSGFIPPGWLMGEGGWAALQAMPFSYTSTRRGVYRLSAQSPPAFTPSSSLVYSVGSALRRWAFQRWNKKLMYELRDNPLLRLGLHPVDAGHPQVVQDWREFLGEALQSREAVTKQGFVETSRVCSSGGATP